MEEIKKFYLYCHLFIDCEKGIVKTIKVPLDSLNVHFIDLKSKIKKLIDNNCDINQSSLYKILSISKTLIAPNFPDTGRLNIFLNNKEDIFCHVEINILPLKSSVIIKNLDDDLLKYKSITNYSFYEANKHIVKVIVPLPGVDKIRKDQITANFTESSCEVKVKNLNGSNFIFGAPRLHNRIIPEKSEVITTKDNIVIRLKKLKDEDNWSYLHKTKFVGETD